MIDTRSPGIQEESMLITGIGLVPTDLRDPVRSWHRSGQDPIRSTERNPDGSTTDSSRRDVFLETQWVL